ncbi:hypothetical protein SAMN04488531_1735 [Corynebacterium coyleae]|uniref:Uncharacterized protein n=1 Tax=Corynebacterium coyleae TaxID=53374 RepID=A0ABX8KTP7_9CORY|nr:hypothetical protein [Corynebacterium coyleae]QXB17897.1 hypothetical protein I6L55_08325 [Corynebacterium coyleae]WJY79338.1 hypothetical protein CCOY_03595 [Corynebacterium coyleae]SEB75420.1 hypothetical protein SAMN04488531_1735 [Corynebacterium coyleae]
MAVDWAKFAAHRKAVVESTGQYLGLLDENGHPLCDLPAPSEMQAPRERNAVSSLQVTFPVSAMDSGVHPAARALVDDTIGVEPSGAIAPTPKTRFVLVERPGSSWCYRVAQRMATGPSDRLREITVHGVDVLSFLQQLPCPSQPAKWARTTFHTFERDWLAATDASARFKTPRDIAEVDFYDSYLSDQVIAGPADEAIGRVIQESVDAVTKLAGLDPSPFTVTVTPTGDKADEVLIKPDDDFIWDVVMPRATAAGIAISAAMVFPETTGEPVINFDVKAGAQ